uniref:Uncharacterized protein n=1 Tax=Zea mays TaxID=4577 RepID=C4J7C7_MAIZE|nr:unknown [Zea mays]
MPIAPCKLSCIGPYSNLSPSQYSKGLERVLELFLTPGWHARSASPRIFL